MAEISSGQSLQFRFQGVHQRPQVFLREIEIDSGGGEKSGQWTRAAEGQGGAIFGHSLSGILPGFEPQLQRSQLGDAVFDVIKRRSEEMCLALP